MAVDVGRLGAGLNDAPRDAPWNVYPCAGDDEWCAVTVRGDAQWQALCAVIGRDDLAADVTLSDRAGRLRDATRIDAALSAWLGERDPATAMTLLQDGGVPAGKVMRATELPAWSYFAERQFFRSESHPLIAAPFLTENAPARCALMPDPPRGPAPVMGEHTRTAVAEWLGLPEGEIDALAARGVLTTNGAGAQPPAAETAAAALIETRGHVMLITLNRPEVRNAVNLAMHLAVGRALDVADADPDIRVVVITGAGDKAFCAGADLVALARGDSVLPDDPAQRAWGFAGFVAHPIGKPVIAAVNGFALGGGTEIALAADLVVAADTATFGLPEVRRGIYAGAGGAFRIVQQIPRKLGLEIALTGEPLDAQRAHAIGLVNRVVPTERLLDEAFALAERIAANAPLSVQATKRIALGIDKDRVAADDEHWARTEREGARVLQSEDAREGPRAFAEKREPHWQAR
jgi:crotonobetainyl-CoA hydratase